MKKIALILLLTALFQNPAFCMCAALTGNDEQVVEYNYAIKDVVFTGKVVDIKVNDTQTAMRPFSGAAITFQVLKQYKGVASGKIEIEGTGCSYIKTPCFAEDSMTFELGQTYLVYAELVDGKLLAGVCDRTRVLLPAENDIPVLEHIMATPGWRFDKEKISELEKTHYLSDFRKEMLMNKINSENQGRHGF
ncbi:MAG: hypothetical protein HQL17_06520 [Candidatus Omnitrophica bacterium]|nr:hypothetical protein [Candidatus Omnitrophota bacterium]